MELRTISRAVLTAATLFALAPATHAASCWTTPRDWSVIPQGIVTYPMLNTDVRDNTNCLKTEVNSDGSITRDVVLFGTHTNAPNSGATPTSVNSYSLTAGKMGTNDDELYIQTVISCAANGNTKTVDIVFGSQALQVSSSACNATGLHVKLSIVRLTATTQIVVGKTEALSGGLGTSAFISEAFTQNLANANAIAFRFTGTSTSDLVQKWVSIEHKRHP